MFAVIGCLTLAELGIRAFVAVMRSPTLGTVANRIDHGWPLSSDGWAYRFYRAHAAKRTLTHDPLYRSHPTRGWTGAPNVAMWREEYRYTTNAYGHRGPGTPSPDSRKTKVMILGDSQSFGDEVDDVFAWPNLLAAQKRDLEVINLSVGGYGLDQMFLAFDEEFAYWRPDVVIFSPVPDDFYRSALRFRDFAKPYFEPVYAQDGALTNLIFHQPVTEIDKVLDILESDPGIGIRRSRLGSLILFAYDKTFTVKKNWEKSAEINSELMRRVVERTRNSGVPVVFMFIGNLGSRNVDRKVSDPAEKQYRQMCHRFANDGLLCPDWRTIAGMRGEFAQRGHYKRLGNEMIAELALKGLAQSGAVSANN